MTFFLFLSVKHYSAFLLRTQPWKGCTGFLCSFEALSWDHPSFSFPHLGLDLPTWRPGHSGLEETRSGSARSAQASTFSPTPVGSSHLPAELPCRLLAQPWEASGQRNNADGGLS